MVPTTLNKNPRNVVFAVIQYLRLPILNIVLTYIRLLVFLNNEHRF
jgi:hypothetical protein